MKAMYYRQSLKLRPTLTLLLLFLHHPPVATQLFEDICVGALCPAMSESRVSGKAPGTKKGLVWTVAPTDYKEAAWETMHHDDMVGFLATGAKISRSDDSGGSKTYISLAAAEGFSHPAGAKLQRENVILGAVFVLLVIMLSSCVLVLCGTGLCNICCDNTQAEDRPRREITSGVRAVIGAQFVFYLAPSMLQPSLFIQIKDKGYLPNPPTVYSAVLTTANIVAMLLPAPLGLWAEYLGERQVYVGVSLGACLSSALLMTSPPASVLAIAWAILNGPPSVRGIHAAYFAKHVAPEDLSWAGQMASSAGLIGGFLGPFVCMLAEGMLGDGSDGAWWDGLTGSALFAAAISMVCAFVLAACLPGKTGRGLSHTSRDSVSLEQCERCSQELDEKERGYATALCDKCWDNYAGVEYSFKRFQLHLLVKWCIIAGLLEFSLNAGIVATFQPVVVTHFNWGSFAIASVTAMGTGLGVVISLAMTCLRLRPKWQTLAASLLYLLGLSIFTAQPLQPWRVILGYLLGIKAQVLFMSPFIAIFSSLIGPVRVTNALTTVLCLAPLVGAALGTSAAPAFMAVSNSPLFILVSLPAFVAVVVIGLEWDLMEGDIEKLRRVARHS
mmetsp:Transcript_63239/g.125033  ORF Transcript_63239/g.125033 Transcript_63239/m.125033 type:complete len:613 (-) Transcript_63239:20-1858(-)